MRRFDIAGAVLSEDDPALPAAIAAAYRDRVRPLCLCRDPGIPMYVAAMGEQFVIKRMPLSGGQHDPACDSYEPPLDLSGLGPLMGSAIRLDPDSGMAALRLEFSLTRTGSRAAPTPGASESSSVKSEARRLSLRALLHLLWHEAGLTKWTSAWAGKRHWWNIRWHLFEAAKTMLVKGAPLSDVLLVPESFRAENKDAIEQRRAATLNGIQPQRTGPRKLMVLVGEVKEFQAARGGHRLVVKHLPGFPFLLDDRSWARVQARFEAELALWAANDASHLIAVATFGLNAAGLAIVEEIALMVVAENWIPYESAQELRLVEALAKTREQSIKGLRFASAAGQPIVSALLMQHRPRPLALFVVPASANESYEAALEELIATRPEIDSWIWHVGQGEMPALPVR
ncbi:MAG: DUF1173 domain-containing protein [Bosea sp.]|uniref:DUF1173 domain-containing protein n=1 Tax=Bosea sp. (in: a-proteobacteria) TaxID=1871050 RepID=UPI002399CA72|nr:DUF1173 domain-containing protein [Bosea sp. (in: a-proteobacteria)]MCP4736124.1 DUF1173 domain-containing protein [Bosea sp. (in: a-proteobacteria)]